MNNKLMNNKSKKISKRKINNNNKSRKITGGKTKIEKKEYVQTANRVENMLQVTVNSIRKHIKTAINEQNSIKYLENSDTINNKKNAIKIKELLVSIKQLVTYWADKNYIQIMNKPKPDGKSKDEIEKDIANKFKEIIKDFIMCFIDVNNDQYIKYKDRFDKRLDEYSFVLVSNLLKHIKVQAVNKRWDDGKNELGEEEYANIVFLALNDFFEPADKNYIIRNPDKEKKYDREMLAKKFLYETGIKTITSSRETMFKNVLIKQSNEGKVVYNKIGENLQEFFNKYFTNNDIKNIMDNIGGLKDVELTQDEIFDDIQDKVNIGSTANPNGANPAGLLMGDTRDLMKIKNGVDLTSPGSITDSIQRITIAVIIRLLKELMVLANEGPVDFNKENISSSIKKLQGKMIEIQKTLKDPDARQALSESLEGLGNVGKIVVNDISEPLIQMGTKIFSISTDTAIKLMRNMAQFAKNAIRVIPVIGAGFIIVENMLTLVKMWMGVVVSLSTIGNNIVKTGANISGPLLSQDSNSIQGNMSKFNEGMGKFLEALSNAGNPDKMKENLKSAADSVVNAVASDDNITQNKDNSDNSDNISSFQKIKQGASSVGQGISDMGKGISSAFNNQSKKKGGSKKNKTKKVRFKL